MEKKNTAVVTVVGNDTIGIIARVSAALARHDANLSLIHIWAAVWPPDDGEAEPVLLHHGAGAVLHVLQRRTDDVLSHVLLFLIKTGLFEAVFPGGKTAFFFDVSRFVPADFGRGSGLLLQRRAFCDTIHVYVCGEDRPVYVRNAMEGNQKRA